ncbi:restriction endonuclease [Pelagibius litoralis]|uniref:Restriction endonuclease n=1 Tax=Pelagibius litoralis TaxID=374515 RepID=A0A967KCV9_9PROT|nr:restriction endonuclease [Pelagibius litoralis]NIA69885.1 restriction endonuclease [Pelagibius litoralis]
MKPTSTSKELEQLAVRIHKLIEPTGATVTWDEHISDPDTGSSRQIDGIIERDGKIIHIECRDHKDPQDVMWIEELIGRRESLQADDIIAVSLSGFGQPALAKAKAKGIVTRTLSEMTDAEIETWGKSAKLVTNYLEISELEFQLIVSYAQSGLVTGWPKLRLSDSNVSPEFLILQELTQNAEGSLYFDRDTNLTAKIQLPALMIDGASVVECQVRVRGRKRQEKEEVLGLWNYHGLEPLVDTEAVVSKYGSGLTEIIQKNDKATMMLDLSSINPPKSCFLLTRQVDFGRVVKAHIDTVGAPYRLETTIDTTIDVKAALP